MNKLVILLFLLSFIAIPVNATWYDTNYAHKIQINITNNAGADLTQFPVVINSSSNLSTGFNTAGQISQGYMQNDCDDIQIVNGTENGNLAFYIENGTCNTQNTIIDFVTNLSTGVNTFYIYFGYASATNNQSKRNVLKQLPGDYSWFDFDEGSGTTILDSGLKANNGTLTNGSSFNTSARGYGLGLWNGNVNDGANLTLQENNGSVSFTIEFWMNPSPTQLSETTVWSDQPVNGAKGIIFTYATFNSTTGYHFMYANTPGNDWEFIKAISPQTNNWSHVIIVKNNTNVTVYLNGTVSTSELHGTSAINLSYGNFTFGRYAGGVNRYWNGSLDVWNMRYYVMNPNEVSARYNGLAWGYGTLENGTVADTTNPTVTINHPLNGTNTSTIYYLNYTVADDIAVDKCFWINTTGVNTSLPTCANQTWNENTDGLKSLTVCANDTSGNVGCTIRNFTRATSDASPPTITLTSPLNTTSINTTYYLNWSCSDNMACDKSWWINTTGVNQSIIGFSNQTWIEGYDGTKSVTVCANDTSGNVKCGSINFTVSRLPSWGFNLSNDTNINSFILHSVLFTPSTGGSLSGYNFTWCNATFNPITQTCDGTAISGNISQSNFTQISANGLMPAESIKNMLWRTLDGTLWKVTTNGTIYSNMIIYLRNSTNNGSTWNYVTHFDSTGFSNPRLMTVNMNSTDSIKVGWADYNNAYYQSYDTRTSTLRASYSIRASSVRNVCLGINSTGSEFMISASTSGSTLWVDASDNGGTSFSNRANAAINGYDHINIDCDIGYSNTIHVCLSDHAGSYYQHYLNSTPSGTSWSTEINVANYPAGNAGSICAIFEDHNYNVHYAWSGNQYWTGNPIDESTYIYYVNKSIGTNTFTTQRNLTSNATQGADTPYITEINNTWLAIFYADAFTHFNNNVARYLIAPLNTMQWTQYLMAITSRYPQARGSTYPAQNNLQNWTSIDVAWINTTSPYYDTYANISFGGSSPTVNTSWITDAYANFGATGWANVTKKAASIAGTYNAWYVSANTSMNVWNATPIFSYILTNNYPFVSIIYETPTPLTNFKQNYAYINVTITSSSPIDSCTLEWWNPTPINESMIKIGSGTSVTCYKNKTGLIDGTTYDFIVYANNTAGVNGSSIDIEVISDQSPPTITYFVPTPSNGDLIRTGYAYINVTAVDSWDDISECVLEWNGINESMAYSISNHVCYKNKTGLSNGVYNYKVFANDTINNTGSTSLRTFTQTVSAGNIILSSPLNSTYVNSQLPLIFTLNMSDTTSNRCWFKNSTGAETFLGNITNNTAYTNNTLLFNLSHIGFYNITLNCEINATSNATTAINFSTRHYIINSQSYTVNVAEGDSTTYSIAVEYAPSIIQTITGGLGRDLTSYSGTVVPINTTTNNITISLIVPSNPDAISFYYQANHTWNIYLNYFNGSILFNNNTNGYQFVYSYIITNCSNSTLTNTTTLNLTLLDETTFGNVTGNIWASFDIYKTIGGTAKKFGFNGTGRNYYEFCIYPTNTSFYVDSLIQYNASTYSFRNYFLTQAQLTNTTQNINLYLLPTVLSTLVTITTNNDAGLTLEGSIVKVQKFYADLNEFKLVAMGKTDNNGKALINLEVNNPFYIFQVEKNAITLLTTYAQQISALGTTLTIRSLDLSSYNFLGNIQSKCNENFTTNIISCWYNDATGLSASYNFSVYKQGVLLNDTICSSVYSSSTGTIFCDVSSQTNSTYIYLLTATYPNHSPMILEWGTFDKGYGVRFGDVGIFLGLLLFLTLAFIGIWNPTATMIFGTLGLVLGIWIGMVPVAGSAVVGIVFGVIIVIWKGRS